MLVNLWNDVWVSADLVSSICKEKTRDNKFRVEVIMGKNITDAWHTVDTEDEAKALCSQIAWRVNEALSTRYRRNAPAAL